MIFNMIFERFLREANPKKELLTLKNQIPQLQKYLLPSPFLPSFFRLASLEEANKFERKERGWG